MPSHRRQGEPGETVQTVTRVSPNAAARTAVKLHAKGRCAALRLGPMFMLEHGRQSQVQSPEPVPRNCRYLQLIAWSAETSTNHRDVNDCLHPPSRTRNRSIHGGLYPLDKPSLIECAFWPSRLVFLAAFCMILNASPCA
jgi:hypothetical protein